MSLRILFVIWFGTALFSCANYKKGSNTVIQKDAIAASQGGASPLYFEPGELPAEQRPSAYHNDRELAVRGGLPNFFSKIKAGMPVTIAFIGGSVTQMDNKYRDQTAKYLKARYPGSTIKFINAGVSGTGSDLGACRVESQVLLYHPDLIFVDYAVNGSFLPGLEGIIRKVIRQDPATDICLLYAIMTGQNLLYAKAEVPDNIVKLETVAAHYGLPGIQLGWEPSSLEAEGQLVFKPDPSKGDKPVFSDGIHPTEMGGWIYAGAIMRSLEKMEAMNKARPHELPAPLIADNWEDAQMLAPEAIVFDKGWQKLDPAADEHLKQFKPWFPYVMKGDKPGASFSFSFRGTGVGIFDIGGPEVGQLELIVDGKTVKKVNRFSHWCNNRYRGQYEFITLDAGTHHVRFAITEEIPDKKALLGAGGLADITAHPEKYDQRVVYIGKVLIRGALLSKN